MSIKSTQNNQISEKMVETRLSVDECKANIKKLGMDNGKIDLLEKNIRAIINNIFDQLENEQQNCTK